MIRVSGKKSVKIKNKLTHIQKKFEQNFGVNLTEGQALIVGLSNIGERAEFSVRSGRKKYRKIRFERLL